MKNIYFKQVIIDEFVKNLLIMITKSKRSLSCNW